MDYGTYTLRDVEFSFIFDGETLTLFPKDKFNEKKAMSLTRRKMGEVIYAFSGDPIKTEDVMVLSSKNQKRALVLFPTSDYFNVEGLYSQTISLNVGSWFRVDHDAKISGLSIHSPVLDFAYDIQGAVDDVVLDQDGNIRISSGRKNGQSFDFIFDDISVNGYFSYARGISSKVGELPIKLESRLSLNFAPTQDYVFIQKIIRLVHRFLAFIAQGYSYEYDNVELLKRCEIDGKSYSTRCAEYIEVQGRENCSELKKAIPINEANGLAQKTFQSLVDNQLVLEHLPSLKERNSYSAARFIMSLAALDKTVKAIYNESRVRSEEALESKKLIEQTLDDLCGDDASNRLKSDVKWLKRILDKPEPLESMFYRLTGEHKILFDNLSGNVFLDPSMLKAFISRIANVRNRIAHGDFDVFLECDFDDILGIDKFLLSAQLVMIGMEDDLEIATIVNNVY